MIILGIETSCDETAISITDDQKILSHIVSSQIKIHQQYGGVVPELASRLHYKNINIVFKQALKVANIKPNKIDYIAFTKEPGLISCLNVGKIFAKTIALMLNKPCLEVNHLLGHLYAASLIQEFVFPALGLTVSGGHTDLFYLKNDNNIKVIGRTLDDAAGECFDKIGRVLGLSYPAGPEIEHLAGFGKIIYELPIAKKDKTLDFSFSGLKSAAINLIQKLKENNNFVLADVCASLQLAICQNIEYKINLALKIHPTIKNFIVGGGVAANMQLRTMLRQITEEHHIKLIIAPKKYCTDNATMICLRAMKQINYYKKEIRTK